MSHESEPQTAGDLSASIARLRRSYDQTPYLSGPLQRAHPGRMAANALWRGLAAPDVATARVLEIGCASGGHLLPLAAALPQAKFLGVDLSPAQIAAGETRRQRLGLANVELRAASFEDLGDADGMFDFIICHGVYSWIPEVLRNSLMRMARQRLAPDGVAMISFNVLPGWRLFQMARDVMRVNARFIDDPSNLIARTRELFERLAGESRDKHSYGKFWRDEARRMARGDDSYLAHEIFEEWNAPETFAAFSDRLARWDLAYLGECTVAANNPETIAAAAATTISALAGANRLARENYIDIFSGRSFRETLIVHGAKAEAIREAPPSDELARFHFIPDLDLSFLPDHDESDVFHLVGGDTDLGFRGEDLGAAMQRWLERRPNSSRIEDLAPSLHAPSKLSEAIGVTLQAAAELGLAAISTTPIGCASGSPSVRKPGSWRRSRRPRAKRRRRCATAHFASSRCSDSSCRCSTAPAPATISPPPRSTSRRTASSLSAAPTAPSPTSRR